MPPDKDTIFAETQPCEAGLPPVRGQSTEVIILGSFPGRLSLLHHEYYGNPQNHFWKIIEVLFQIDHHLLYRVRISRLTEQQIALWDVISACSREGSADARIYEPILIILRIFSDLARHSVS